MPKGTNRTDAFFNRLLYRLAPGTCLLCGLITRDERDICPACEAHLPRNLICCPQCALPMDTSAICGQCLANPPLFHQVLSPWVYSPPIDGFIARFKNRGDLRYGHLLANALLEVVESGLDFTPDALIPVPLHWRRQFTRGFNQAEWIARKLAIGLNIPVHARAVLKQKATPAQHTLDQKKRQNNLRNSFRLSVNVEHQRLVLIDDVVTTGSTVNEIGKLLLNSGAEKVAVWSLARTPLEK